MARSIPVQEIVDEVQVLIEDPLHAVAPETEYLRRVNRHYARLHAFYVGMEPDRYRTEATITVSVADTASYPLPEDWLSTIGIDAVVGNQRPELVRLHEEERNDYIGQTGQSRAFRLLGSNVVLYPTPIVGQVYRHIYLPTAPVLLIGASVDCRVGHEAWLEWCVARDLLKAKQEYDGRWDDDIAKLEVELKMEANLRYFTDVVTLQAKRNRRPWPYGSGADDFGFWRLP